ncbi:5-amino-6-(5-phosphoribosylamino)uracil reductase, putative [Candida dubliniensis CD36]|uniref:2,5-diamino-6-ribosylamino-4(3H)-pyrimidinone 5'-phosphate reductase n=1 Tax=Candida dubliniensis (strain CD36 / ATCC MYA-646 / CBS 7987 / NCPF 3949 / NRRL Y-17841) TaxID=573826 RepID=B9W9R9_CANDC|nr:5-amino-6-(5-phosphoribosylamino)uracil reductase, putative [Candida dubliniensis CD36]CAX45554.1 5-amino-6-(5-phosphoribosylamino)uracil reductase, putative [Candida dubliniensis CD36]
MSLIPLPESLKPFLDPYLPTQQVTTITTTTTNNNNNDNKLLKRPFVTLTYAQSLDSKIAAQPGTQTKLSHLETKTMTHYLRSKHDCILVGIGTILADDPKLNCRYIEPIIDKGVGVGVGVGVGHQIRPVVIDPHGKWQYHQSQLCRICQTTTIQQQDNKQNTSPPPPPPPPPPQAAGLAPFIIIDESTIPNVESEKMVNKQGGKYIKLPLLSTINVSINWVKILQKLYQLGLKSIMIEGGAKIINDLLSINDYKLIDSIIITIAPVFLGCNGVTVHPYHNILLKDINWWTGIQDSIIAGRIDYQ